MSIKSKLTTVFNALTGKGHSDLYQANASAAHCGLGSIGAFAAAAALPVGAAASAPLLIPGLLVGSFMLAVGSMLNLAVVRSIQIERHDEKQKQKKAALQNKLPAPQP